MTDNYDIIQAITESVHGLMRLHDALAMHPNTEANDKARQVSTTIAVLRQWHESLENEMESA